MFTKQLRSRTGEIHDDGKWQGALRHGFVPEPPPCSASKATKLFQNWYDYGHKMSTKNKLLEKFRTTTHKSVWHFRVASMSNTKVVLNIPNSKIFASVDIKCLLLTARNRLNFLSLKNCLNWQPKISENFQLWQAKILSDFLLDFLLFASHEKYEMAQWHTNFWNLYKGGKKYFS